MKHIVIVVGRVFPQHYKDLKLPGKREPTIRAFDRSGIRQAQKVFEQPDTTAVEVLRALGFQQQEVAGLIVDEYAYRLAITEGPVLPPRQAWAEHSQRFTVLNPTGSKSPWEGLYYKVACVERNLLKDPWKISANNRVELSRLAKVAR